MSLCGWPDKTSSGIVTYPVIKLSKKLMVNRAIASGVPQVRCSTGYKIHLAQLFFQKFKSRNTYDPAIPLVVLCPEDLRRETERAVHAHVHSTILRSSRKVETLNDKF